VSLVGMALRGRWGLFGTKPDMPEQSWWAFRCKDCESRQISDEIDLTPSRCPSRDMVPSKRERLDLKENSDV
jgi:hypothetical protein